MQQTEQAKPAIAEAVVIDTADGYTFDADAEGKFTVESAKAFAESRNAELVTPTYRVFELKAL